MSKSALPICPEIVSKRAKILEQKGFGYEFDEITSKFLICSYKPNNNVQEICDEFRATTLENDTWWNRLRIHWSEYHLIDRILQLLVEKNITFTLSGTLNVWWGGNIDLNELKASGIIVNENRGFKFNQRARELLKIKQFKEVRQLFTQTMITNDPLMRTVYGFGNPMLCNPWNWSSLEGQEFCAQTLRPLYSLPSLSDSEAMNHSDNFWNWQVFRNCNLTSLRTHGQDLHDDEKVKVQDEVDEIEECLICLSARPSTKVWPCKHKSVCDACAEGLKQTPDKTICVRCRQPIQRIEHVNS